MVTTVKTYKTFVTRLSKQSQLTTYLPSTIVALELWNPSTELPTQTNTSKVSSEGNNSELIVKEQTPRFQGKLILAQGSKIMGKDYLFWYNERRLSWNSLIL